MQTAHNGVAVRMLRADRTDRLSSWLENAAPVLTLAIVCGSVLGLWVLPLRSSLWTDETGTVWALRGTLQEALYRAWVYPGQPSALYTVLAWLTAAAGGLHEATLRLPSLLAMLLSAVVLYRLGLRFGDSFQGLLAVAVFATYRTVIFAASDARPYAFALLAVLAAALTIVKWCETGRPRYGLLFILSAAASVWLHYLSAATLAVDAALVLWWPSRNRPRPIVLLLAEQPYFCYSLHWRLTPRAFGTTVLSTHGPELPASETS